MNNQEIIKRGYCLPGRQKGVATLLTVVLMLLAMSIMALFGAKVGIFEHTASANDARQKQAFHAAEAGISIAIEHIRANLNVVLSSGADGWFAPVSKRWLGCPDSPAKTHPCYVEKDTTRRANSFYYVEDADSPDVTNINLGVNVLPDGEGVEVSAVLCPLDVDYSVSPPVVNGCTSTPDREMLVTVIARGTSDNGRGQAIVKQVLADYDIAGGVPGASLTAPFVGLPNGTADIVANPNGGGEGVPLSVWSANDLTLNGVLRTCEAYEFYDQPSLPSDISCPGCDCAVGSELSSKFTRYSDIRDGDPNFPADLFQYFFDIPKPEYESMKSSMNIANNCNDFSEDSNGAYWVSGGCSINGSECKIGTQDRPVFLVIAGDFEINGCDVFGMIFVTDSESPGVEMKVKMNGGATVYGAVMVDHNMQQANGSMAIVYNEEVLNKANSFNGIAGMPGGWSDFL